MKGKFSLAGFSLMLALALPASIGLFGSANVHAKAGASKSIAQIASTATGKVAAIVELESEPVALHQRRAERIPRREIDFESADARAYELQLEGEHESFKSRAALVSPNMRVRTELRKLANAVSVEASPSEIEAMAAIPGVKRVELVKEYFATTNASVPLINSPMLWSKLGGASNAGQGIKIAILDTGIDITNPLFSDTGYAAPAGFPRSNNSSGSLTNNKVIVAKSFLSGGPRALDENGHGTNVAGIAAGNAGTLSPLGPLSGVAPRAYLGNYRVLGASGGGPTDLIGRGIDEAVTDRFDVINLSLGSPDPPTAAGFLEEVVQRAVDSAVIVVIAAGNNQTAATVGQPMTIRSPGIAPGAITVGATSNSHLAGERQTAIVSVPGSADAAVVNVTASRGIGAVDPPALDGALGPLPYVDVSTLDGGNRACGSLPVGSLTGRIALIERGNGCTFASKVNASDQAGARAAIIYNKDVSEGADGGENLLAFGVDGTRILSVLVRRSTGLAFRSWLQSHPGAQVSILPQPVGEVDVPSDVLATFSALGPSVLEGIKPDVTAPGINIYSGAVKTGDASGVVDPSGFLAINGTSQAAPHVSGAAALVKQLNPSFTPEQVKSVLISSSTVDVFTTVDKMTRVGVLSIGGGRIDLARAGTVSATFSPASLSFGIRKLKKFDVEASIALNITSQVDGQNTFTVSVQQLDPGDGVNVVASAGSVSLNRGETKTVTITNTAIVGSQRRDYTGYVIVTGGGQPLHVPYWVRYVKRKA